MIPTAAQPDNPFASRYVRPGAMAYRFSDGQSAPKLIGRLQEHGWRGQIVGPHGSGKSSLVATLVPWLKQARRELVMYTLHDGERRLPAEPALAVAACGARRASTSQTVHGKHWAQATQVIVDGYEQLSLLSRWRLHWAVHRARCGLLVTAHADSGLPDLVHVQPALPTVWAMIEHLLAAEPMLLSRDEVAASFARNHGNVREILFDLYDLYERIRRQYRKEW